MVNIFWEPNQSWVLFQFTSHILCTKIEPNQMMFSIRFFWFKIHFFYCQNIISLKRTNKKRTKEAQRDTTQLNQLRQTKGNEQTRLKKKWEKEIFRHLKPDLDLIFHDLWGWGVKRPSREFEIGDLDNLSLISLLSYPRF